MDINTFVANLWHALADKESIAQVEVHTEGPVANGHIYVQFDSPNDLDNTSDADGFVRFYFNQHTQTIAFALIKDKQRLWGIDRDNLRGWHMHPVDDPASHIEITPLSVSDIVAQLCEVLEGLA